MHKIQMVKLATMTKQMKSTLEGAFYVNIQVFCILFKDLTRHNYLKKGLSRKAAAHCAHSLSAFSGQLAHLRAEKCFSRRTCRRKKQISSFSHLRARTPRGFFDKLRAARYTAGGSLYVVPVTVGPCRRFSPAWWGWTGYPSRSPFR